MDSKKMYLPGAEKLARAYYDIGENACTWGSNNDWSRIIAGYTNIAFSCEVSLKALAKETGLGELNGHNLKSLYEKLQPLWGNIIRDLVIAEFRANGFKDYSDDDFYDDLNKYGNAYVEGRYWYEYKKEEIVKKEAGIRFMRYFAKALLYHIEETIKTIKEHSSI